MGFGRSRLSANQKRYEDMSRVFVDANIILDLIDSSRGNKHQSTNCIKQFIVDGYELYTSCDILTTVYYVASKKMKNKEIVNGLESLLEIIKIIPIDIEIIKNALNICTQNDEDFEDVLQYTCAKKFHCDTIITNDNHFYCTDIKAVGCKSEGI
jgi:predicted nucleic acid-binding protein